MSLDSEIAKIVKANGAEFYDSEVVSEGEETIFRISITREEGVNLDLCAEISHALSPFLDVHPPMSSPYRLEVSSPGIERRLRKTEHFKSAIGENVKLKVPGQDRLKGVLKSVDNKGITVETRHGDESYSYRDILTAKTYFDWNRQK
ncbi:MAG: ribosome maturation factor RimP [Campylobacterota bacterium]|nr:ribosome maturation factor RimP [Campylobacterota bacterium]